jgi:hypothetical protein
MSRDEKLGGLLTGKTKPLAEQGKPPADNSDLENGLIRPSGVGLREGEIMALDAIASYFDISRNSLLRLAARRLIFDFRAGRLDIAGMIETPRTPKKRLRY